MRGIKSTNPLEFFSRFISLLQNSIQVSFRSFEGGCVRIRRAISSSLFYQFRGWANETFTKSTGAAGFWYNCEFAGKARTFELNLNAALWQTKNGLRCAPLFFLPRRHCEACTQKGAPPQRSSLP
jgi:hypothetical protein